MTARSCGGSTFPLVSQNGHEGSVGSTSGKEQRPAPKVAAEWRDRRTLSLRRPRGTRAYVSADGTRRRPIRLRIAYLCTGACAPDVVLCFSAVLRRCVSMIYDRIAAMT